MNMDHKSDFLNTNQHLPRQKLLPWSVTTSKTVLEDQWIKVRADECITADGVEITPYYVFDYPDWVNMVVVNDQDQILITEQYRHGAGKVLSELPCGTQDKSDKDPHEAAKRELLEETGYAGDFVLAGKTHPNSASQTNTIHVFLVTNPTRQEEPQYDPKEVMNYEFIDIERVYDLIDKSKFQQALHISSLFIALRKYHEKRQIP